MLKRGEAQVWIFGDTNSDISSPVKINIPDSLNSFRRFVSIFVYLIDQKCNLVLNNAPKIEHEDVTWQLPEKE